MSARLLQYVKELGFADGVRLYLNGKKKHQSSVALSSLKHPVYFRGINSDKFMFRQIFISKEYNLKVNSAPKLILDLGANVGYAAIFFANKFPDAKIIALEPDDSNYALAELNTKPYANIQLLKGAVWHQSEKINVVDKGFGKAGMVIEKGEGEHSVKAYTIKELMEIAGAIEIDILKIDIEGAEKEIFEYGYEDWIPKSKMIIVETHDRYKDGTSKAVMSAMCKYNFSLELSGENLIFYNEDYTPGFTKYIPE